jgi:hypothetical protein
MRLIFPNLHIHTSSNLHILIPSLPVRIFEDAKIAKAARTEKLRAAFNVKKQFLNIAESAFIY